MTNLDRLGGRIPQHLPGRSHRHGLRQRTNKTRSVDNRTAFSIVLLRYLHFSGRGRCGHAMAVRNPSEHGARRFEASAQSFRVTCTVPSVRKCECSFTNGQLEQSHDDPREQRKQYHGPIKRRQYSTLRDTSSDGARSSLLILAGQARQAPCLLRACPHDQGRPIDAFKKPSQGKLHA